MPAFDPVRDAVLNSPIDSPGPSPSLGRRATDLAVLLNSNDRPTQLHHRPTSIHSLLLDDTLASAGPISRTSPMHDEHSSPSSFYPSTHLVDNPSPPAPRSAGGPTMRSKRPLPYNPKRRTEPDSVLIPLSPEEIEKYKNYRGRGTARLATKRKRALSDEPESVDARPVKKHTGDVGVVVQHYNSRPEVGVVQRLESPIIGLKAFNNWIKSVLIARFAHPVLAKSSIVRSGGARRGKVFDMGCGKGGDLSKWAKSRPAVVFFADIAAVSVEQARGRWVGMNNRYEASFAAIDCYSEPISKGFPPAKLVEPFDVVTMQFCMHYAFETLQKARCMLDNVTRYLRRGGIFIGTIPNSEMLLEQLDRIPADVEDKSFGNSVYKITFENSTERPLYGHRYWFYLQDAVENVPEYIVHWDTFVQLAAEFGLHPVFKEEFHQVYAENHERPEFKDLLIKMKVIDPQGVSAMDEDQWEAANIYIAFAFEKL